LPGRELGQETVPLEPASGPATGTVPAGPAPASVLLGRTLAGRFRLLRFLGRGGMGEVYEARDLVLQTTVAVKTLTASLASDPGAIDRLRREVLLARRVAHPNVCRIHELHQDLDAEALTFIAMEYLEGETLGQRLARSGPIPAPEALSLLEQLADGLGAIHREGLVHRDFKPGNVMLVRSGDRTRAVVMDFGIARVLHDSRPEGSGPTLTDSLGTPRYMAPEQLRGGQIGAWTDVHAFALVAQELVTGAAPGVESPSGLPAGWNGPLRRGTALSPGRRQESPAALVRDLRRGRRPATRALALAALVAAAIPLALWLAPRVPRLVTRRAPVIPSTSARLAIVPVGAEDSEALAGALRTEFSLPGAVRANEEVEIGPALRKAAPSEVATVSGDLLDELRRSANSEYALLASTTAAGPDLTVKLAMYRTADGSVLGSTELAGRADQFADLARRAGTWARQGVQLPVLGVAEARALRAAHASTLELATLLASAQKQLALDRPTDALPALETLVRREPGLAMAQAEYARSLVALGRVAMAKEVWARAAEAARALPEVLRLRIEQGYWESLGDWAESRKIRGRLLTLTPDDATLVLATLGNSLQARQARLAAVRKELPALTLRPEFDAAEAVVALQAGDPTGALAAIERGERKIPDYEDRLRRQDLFWWWKSSALSELKRLDEALSLNRAALETLRSEKQLNGLAEGLWLSANTFHTLRQWGAAVDSLRQSRELWPRSGADFGADEDLRLVTQLVDNLMHLGQADESARELEALARRHPQECAVHVDFVGKTMQVAMARGRLPEAQAAAGVLEGLGGEARRGGPLFWLAFALDDLPRMEAVRGDRDVPVANGMFARMALEGIDLDELMLAEAKFEATPPERRGTFQVPKPNTDGFGARSNLLRLESRVALARGDLPEALARANAALAAALRYPDSEVEWDARLQLGRARFAAGDRSGADETLRPIEALARAGGYRQITLEARVVRAGGEPTSRARKAAALRVAREAAQLGFRRIAREAREVADAS